MNSSDATHILEEVSMSEHPTAESTHLGPSIRLYGAKNIIVAGGTKELNKELRALGGKWVAKERGYSFLSNLTDQVQALIDGSKSEGYGAVVETPLPTGLSSTEDPTLPAEDVDAPPMGSSLTMVDPFVDTVVETDTAVVDSSVPIALGGGFSSDDPPAIDSSLVDPGSVMTEVIVSATAAPGASIVTVEEHPAPGSSSASGSGSGSASAPTLTDPVAIVHINTRSIAVLGKPSAAVLADLDKLGGKFNKTIKIGDDKHVGWTFNKSVISALTKLLPGVAIIPLKPSSPTARSSSSRKPAAVVGSSSKTDTPVSSPEKEKRKRQRTSKAEESAAQAHAPHAGEQVKMKT